MGCLIGKLRSNPPENKDIELTRINDHPYVPNPNPNPNPNPPPELPKRLPKTSADKTLPSNPTDQSCVQLHVPIYVALRSFNDAEYKNISFEEGDEMELIEELTNSDSLRVRHLRTDQYSTVLKRDVRLDPDTPLRLAVDDRGIIEQCILMSDTPGTYLIRRSRMTPKNFTLSIFQEHNERHTLVWHYLIGVDQSNNCFYFNELQTVFFSTFQQLVTDERVRKIIPMTVIMPYTFKQNLWRIPYDQLQMEHRLGSGAFGEVWRAQWKKSEKTTLPVAVKKLRFDGVANEELEREITAMKALRHFSVVSLFGIADDPVTKQSLLITEYMENGDLKSWLKQLSTLPEFSTLLRFSRDIALGMNYLELKNYTHRDLACRNLLLTHQAATVKIADFGLSALIEHTDGERRRESRSEKLPLRWSPPELLNDPTTFSIKSDIWSFGIVLIEIWLKGDDPYYDEHVQWIRSAVLNGFVHKRPNQCPEKFYRSVICPCLAFNPNDRPRFSTLAKQLQQWKK